MIAQSEGDWDRQYAKGRWDRLLHYNANTARIAQILAENTRREPLRVADIGCGNGGLALLIAGNPVFDYIGTDFSAEAIREAARAVPRARFVIAPAELPPPDITNIDALVFNEILYYADPRRVLPAYRDRVSSQHIVIISMLRMWRTPFIWWRIRKYLTIQSRERVRSAKNQFDIAICAYKK